MKTTQEDYYALRNLLGQSLFSQSNLMDGFSDENALITLNIIQEYVKGISRENSVTRLIDNLLIESIARGVGHGENHGPGFPFDLIEKWAHMLETEIEEDLLLDVLEWRFSLTGYEMITVKKGDEEDFYFCQKSKPQELIHYSTFSNICANEIENIFSERYDLISRIVIKEIPATAWYDIIDKGESIEKYL